MASSLLVERLGLRADVIVRSATEWATVVATNPFPGEAERDPSHLVLFAKRPVTQAAFNIPGIAIAKAGGRETIGGPDPHVYVTHPDGIGRSKITTPLIERALGTPVTGRNWNAVMKLLALAGGLDARPSEQGLPLHPIVRPNKRRGGSTRHPGVQ